MGVSKENTVKELVRKSQADDLTAFEQLVLLYQKRVYTLGYQLTGNYDDAQDLSQEAMIKAFYSIKGFRSEADFGTWLHRITVNLWINTRRKNRIENTYSLDQPISMENGNDVKPDLPAENADPLEIAERNEFKEAIRKSLKELSKEHQAVIVLREMQGYSYEEISSILSCSVGTVKSRLNRARQTLKEKLLTSNYN